ncbi:hypothetical protein P4H83_12390 [Paenibacillus favisporus]|uniref:hypothetical protein n=1 Tax=Paenibacillus favisporus TaxID=221028 RepID=UPI002DBB1F85|nr:hypothetical protein [Paenibacillus favisporus]MEC0175660.1 hypothetical protein [Paenibacillus favisporus]
MTASADSSLTFGKGKIVPRGTADVFCGTKRPAAAMAASIQQGLDVHQHVRTSEKGLCEIASFQVFQIKRSTLNNKKIRDIVFHLGGGSFEEELCYFIIDDICGKHAVVGMRKQQREDDYVLDAADGRRRSLYG